MFYRFNSVRIIRIGVRLIQSYSGYSFSYNFNSGKINIETPFKGVFDDVEYML
jgi:hypothetical protein